MKGHGFRKRLELVGPLSHSGQGNIQGRGLKMIFPQGQCFTN